MERNLGRDRKIIDRSFSDIFRLVSWRIVYFYQLIEWNEYLELREWNIEFIIKYNEL